MSTQPSNWKKFEIFEVLIIIFFWVILFSAPLMTIRSGSNVDWNQVLKIWKEHSVLLALFLLNRFMLLPLLLFRGRRIAYIISVFIMISTAVGATYYFNRKEPKSNRERPLTGAVSPERRAENRPPRPPGQPPGPAGKDPNQPQPLPPYVNLLILSVLVFGFDSGLRITARWIHSEQLRINLEKQNIESQLAALKHQVSPHFFMNTLNNIYGLIDADKEKSKEAVIKLSRLMRYLLYENQNGKVLLSKEFAFIRNYIDLMKLRFVDDVEISLEIPEVYDDVEVPVLIFVSYIENAFKFGTSYEKKSFINVSFGLEGNFLLFRCTNSKNLVAYSGPGGGIGLKNSRERLDLIYNGGYSLEISDNDETYSVLLKIPLR